MHNILVTGCGRSGTSMVAGTLATAGYQTDDHEWGADRYNPKGYFESLDVHRINDILLAPYIHMPLGGNAQALELAQAAGTNLGWIGLMGRNVKVNLERRVIPDLKRVVSRTPFCLKDVRFAYTLEAWRPFLGGAKFVCVFRNPEATIESLVHYCQQRAYLRPFQVDHAYAEKLWVCIYSHILNERSALGDWLFLHYDQLFDQTALDRLEAFAQASVDRAFPDQNLRKQEQSAFICQPETKKIFLDLCARASFESGL